MIKNRGHNREGASCTSQDPIGVYKHGEPLD